MTINERFKLYRKHKNFSQEKVAQLGGASQSSYAAFEKGQQTIGFDFIIEFYRNTDISWEWVVYGIEPICRTVALEKTEELEKMMQYLLNSNITSADELSEVLGLTYKASWIRYCLDSKTTAGERIVVNEVELQLLRILYEHDLYTPEKLRQVLATKLQPDSDSPF